jgi:hypothetical protein
MEVTLSCLVLAFLLFDPRFVGSNTTEDNERLRAIKIHSTAFFRGESKAVGPMSLYGILKKTMHMKEIFCDENLEVISLPSFFCFTIS